MGGTKCLRLGTCELEYMGGVLQKNSSIREGGEDGTRGGLRWGRYNEWQTHACTRTKQARQAFHGGSARARPLTTRLGVGARVLDVVSGEVIIIT